MKENLIEVLFTKTFKTIKNSQFQKALDKHMLKAFTAGFKDGVKYQKYKES